MRRFFNPLKSSNINSEKIYIKKWAHPKTKTLSFSYTSLLASVSTMRGRQLKGRCTWTARRTGPTPSFACASTAVKKFIGRKITIMFMWTTITSKTHTWNCCPWFNFRAEYRQDSTPFPFLSFCHRHYLQVFSWNGTTTSDIP